MQEIWEDIKGYEGLYQISNLGRVKSLKRKVPRRGNTIREIRERIIRLGIAPNKYASTTLHKDGKQKKFWVHRLVANAFIPNTYNLPQINHKDENPLNNKVDNLEWCDSLYNNNYNDKNLKIAKKVYQYSLDGTLIKEWDSITECGRNGFNFSDISACCRDEYGYKTHKGYIWSYVLLSKEKFIESEPYYKKFCKKVYQYSLEGVLIKEWDSVMECGRNGFSQGNISNCCIGKGKTHKGYIWSYKKL